MRGHREGVKLVSTGSLHFIKGFSEGDTSPRPLQRGTIKCRTPLEKGVIKSIFAAILYAPEADAGLGIAQGTSGTANLFFSYTFLSSARAATFFP